MLFVIPGWLCSSIGRFMPSIRSKGGEGISYYLLQEEKPWGVTEVEKKPEVAKRRGRNDWNAKIDDMAQNHILSGGCGGNGMYI